MAEMEEYTAELLDWELLQHPNEIPSLETDDSETQNYLVVDSDDGVTVEVRSRGSDGEMAVGSELEEEKGKGMVEVPGDVNSSDLMGRMYVEEEKKEGSYGGVEIVKKIESKSDDSQHPEEVSDEVDRSITSKANSLESETIPMKKSETENIPIISNGISSKLVLFWKLPLDLIKYCIFNMKPVWSISIAAMAVMGFVMLGKRRWYRLKKKKNQTIPVNLSFSGSKVNIIYIDFLSRY